MATDQKIHELLAEADEALAEAGFRTGDFSTARDLAEKAKEEASRTSDAAGHARALNSLGMVAHYENLTMLISGSKPSSADIDTEEKLFRQALLRWQEFAQRPAGESAGTADADSGADAGGADSSTDAGSADAGGADADGADSSTDAGSADAGGADADAAAETDTASTGTASTGTAAAGSADHGTADAGTAQALFGLGLVFQVLHEDWMTAMPYFWQALDLVSKPDTAADPYLRSEVHRHVGFYFLVEDAQPSEAVRHLQLSLDLREELADPRRIPSGLQALGRAELSAGNRERAVELLTRAVAQARAAGLMQQRIEDAEKQLREAGSTPAAEDGPAPAETAEQSEPESAETAEKGETEPTPAETPEQGNTEGTETGG
jgi:tetratricopeptide (TPR) repeat protein